MRRAAPAVCAGLLAALALPACSPPAPRGSLPPAFAERGPRREVQVTVEALPNYLTHMTALAGLPWPSAYADRFGHTVSADNHAILRQHAPLLQWGQGRTGDLAPFFVLLPAYLPLEDEFDLYGYLRAVDTAMRAEDYGEIFAVHPRAHERLQRWLFDFEGFFYSRSEAYHEHLRAVRQLSHVYEHSYQAWEEEVWRDVELDLELTADELNGDIWSLELLSEWERLTGERFAGRRFEVVLTAAPAGPGITGLGYERSLLSAQVGRERMLGLIVHEVGTHLLVDLYREMSSQAADSGELDWTSWAAYAGLTLHYTRQILPEYHTEIENDVEIFAGIYRQLADEEPGAGARRLMRRALAEHRAGRW